MQLANWSIKQLWPLIPLLLFALAFVGCVNMRDHTSPGGNTGDSHAGTGGTTDHTDKDAPKTIVSQEISSFSHAFCPGGLYVPDWFNRTGYEYYTFTLERQEDGAWCICEGMTSDEGRSPFRIAFLAPATALYELQTILDTHQLAIYNGTSKTTHGIPEHLGGHLRVEYASGETISSYNNAERVISAKASADLLVFFHGLAREAGRDFLYTAGDIADFQNDMAGRWESEGGKHALVFDGDSLQIYENGALVDDTTYYQAFDQIYNEHTENGRFTNYMLFTERDGWIVGIWEDGSEINFRVTERPAAYSEDG